MKINMKIKNNDIKTVAPPLRFPEFRDAEGWEQTILENTCEMQAGKFVPASNIYEKRENEMYPCYGGNGLRGYTYSFTHSGVYLLIGRQGALCGNVTFVDDTFHATEHAVVVTCKEGIVPRWLYYQLTKSNLNQYATGQAQPGLSVEVIKKIAVSIPKEINKQIGNKEQQKIADCLGSLDDLISAVTDKIETLKEYKKGLMQQLFPAEGKTTPTLRFPEFQNAGEWEEILLGNISTFINGRAYKQNELLESGKYRVLRVGNFFSNNNWYYSNLELEDNKYCIKGDLLYAWSASFGPRMWNEEKVIFHYHIWKVIEHKGISKDFLFTLLSYETERIKKQQAKGLGLLHITKEAIESWKTRITKNVLEQQKIADSLSSVDELISAETDKLDQLKTHKKGLMQQLFPTINK